MIVFDSGISDLDKTTMTCGKHKVVRICFYNSKRQNNSFWNGTRYIPFTKNGADPDCTVILSKKSLNSILQDCSEVHETSDMIVEHLPGLGRIYHVEAVGDELIQCLDSMEEEYGSVLFIADITNSTPEQAFSLSYVSMLFDMKIYRRNNEKGGFTEVQSMPQIVLLDEAEGSVIRKHKDDSFTAKDLLDDPDVQSVPNLIKAQRTCSNLLKFGLITQHANPSRRPGNSERKYTVDRTGTMMERINRRIVNGKMNRIQK